MFYSSLTRMYTHKNRIYGYINFIRNALYAYRRIRINIYLIFFFGWTTYELYCASSVSCLPPSYSERVYSIIQRWTYASFIIHIVYIPICPISLLVFLPNPLSHLVRRTDHDRRKWYLANWRFRVFDVHHCGTVKPNVGQISARRKC